MLRDALDRRLEPAQLLRWVPPRPLTVPAREVLRRAVLVAAPAWAVSRLLALGALLLAEALHGGTLRHTGDLPAARGWWAWDAGWYRDLSMHGYADAPAGGVRFFPLFPLLGRGLGAALGGHDGIALVLIANLCALGYGAAIVLLVQRELDVSVARRSVWLTLIAPGAVVLALAYSEPLSGLLSAAYLVAVRARGRWIWWALPIGVLAGLTRPTGVVLAVVPVVELLLRRGAARRVRALVGATLTPMIGAGIYCAWSAAVFGNAWLPYTTQSDQRLRGTIIGNPVHGLLNPPAHGGLPPAANVAIALAAVVLLVAVWRLLPASIALWATLSALAALTSAHAMSLPRYLSADFPLLIALAALARQRIAAVTVGVLCAAAFVAVAVGGFDGGFVL